jgi:hypothetical protein
MMKRLLLLTSALTAACLLSACGAGSEPGEPAPSDGRSAATPSPTAASAAPSSRSDSPVASAHSGFAQGPSPGGASAQTPSGAPASGDKPEMATPELDKRIAAAEAKAKRPGASEADRRAAAAAYFERGELFFKAGNPRLYKYSLGDLRRTLRYQPDHADAKTYVAELERIYRSMGRPIPPNGLEP